VTVLELFGTSLSVPAEGYAGAVGGLDNELRIDPTPLPGHRLRLRCSFKGAVPFGSIATTEWSMEGRVANGRLVCEAVQLVSGGRLSSDAAIGLAVAASEIRSARLAKRQGHTVVFTTATRLIHELLDRMRGGIVAALDPDSWSGDGFAVAPDFEQKLFLFVPQTDAPRIQVVHTYQNQEGRTFASKQELAIGEVRAGPGYTAVRGTAARLYVHGDLLDKRPASSANHVFYQHALVNGELDFQASHQDLGTSNVSWVGVAGEPPILLALRWRDEHGHPLAFAPGNGSFQLSERDGFATSEPDGLDPDQADLSNRSIGVVADQPQAWKLRSLDPVLHYRRQGQPREQFGPVTTRPRSPREIHGMAHGVVLRAPPADDLECVFTCDSVMDDRHRTIAWLPQVAFGGGGPQWSFHSYLEERDSNSTEQILSARSARGQGGKGGPTLPLVDPMPVGVNLATEAGLYAGTIAKRLDAWLRDQDLQFTGSAPTWLASAARLTDDAQAHCTGFALLAGPELLKAVLNNVRVKSSIDDLKPMAPRLLNAAAIPGALGAVAPVAEAANDAIGYVHGVAVDGDFARTVEGIEARLQQAGTWNDALVRLMNQWVKPDPEIAEAMHEVRRLLGIRSVLPPPVTDWVDDTALEPWLELKERAIEIALLGDLDDLDAFDSDDLVPYLADLDIEEFAATCLASLTDPNGPEGGLLSALVRWLDAPVTPDLFRRVVRLLLPVGTAGDADATGRLDRLRDILSGTGLTLTAFCDLLFGTGFQDAAKELLKNLGGVLTDLGLGESQLLEAAKEAWEHASTGALQDLKRRFGPILTDDVIDRIAASEADAASLLAALREVQLDVHDLAELVRRPPEYLFASRRFATAGADWDKALRLWSGRFGLAKLAESLNWHFFLGDVSSVVVKLGDRRSIEDILRETNQRFRTEQRPDPLGLGGLDPRHPTVDGGMALLRNRMGDALADPMWTGLFILRPTADISEDGKLRDLCGFEYIEALFIAVAGRPLDGSLDITAAIERRSDDDAVAALQGRPAEEWQGDTDFGLTKFSVTIRRSMLHQADIAFQVRVKNLMGQVHPDKPANARGNTITLRGTLPPEDPSRPGQARDIEFAAVMDPPLRIGIELFCLDYIDFAALRVGRRNGKTFLDIDADAKMRQFSYDNYPNFFDSLENLRLRGLRIALPSLLAGESRPIGEALGLDFDWPSVEFSIPRSRGLQLFGLEVVPTGMGLLRRLGEEWEAFRARFGDVDNWGLPELAGRLEVPHVRFRLSFGSLPGLGGGGKLSLDLVFGVPVENGVPRKPFIAIEGFAGREITIDLFRLITVKIKQLIFKRNWTFSLDGSQQKASGIVADRVELKILNWNPFGDRSSVSLASFHRTDEGDEFQRNAFVVGYEKSLPPAPSSTFVRIHWLVLGQNIELHKKAYNYLLGKDPMSSTAVGPTKSLLTELLVYKKAESDNATGPPDDRRPPELVDGVLAANFTRNPSWLFAISFSLGDILQLGTLVLHDQHYYGIRLRDPNWVPLVFGQESIEFAYIPGRRKELDRFRTNLRIPFLDMLGPMRSGEIALEWAVNWDFLIDIGYPWKTELGHNWFRAFSLPVGTYEGKFGFYIEKRTDFEPSTDEELLLLGCGAALYIGLFAGYGNSVAYVRAGIGIFGMFEGRFWLRNARLDKPATLLKATVAKMEIGGTIGIFAYAEGRIEVWILSASFRAWAEASLTSTILYIPGGTCAITYSALLAAAYSASVEVGSGWFSWTFSVSGSVSMEISGRVLLA
jgi:hypothetical protein